MFHAVGETVTEVLFYVPARFEVMRHVRPACSCRKCETMMKTPIPELSGVEPEAWLTRRHRPHRRASD